MIEHGSPRKVPVGIDATTWTTVGFERTVLAVVHNITTLTRVLDVITLFDSDPRVQVVATVAETDPFDHGVRRALDDAGIITVPWPQATQLRFDLIIAASHHGNLVDLHGPLMILSHGVGYTKHSPGARSQEPGARSQEPGARSVFGLSAQWLLYDGKPIADKLVLSHPEQLERMRAAAPEAVHTAVVAGDPCFDRIRASLTYRTHFRRLFGADDGHRVVVVSSTWGRRSLLGSHPELLRRLLAESAVDTTRVIAVVHPNAWHGHGPWQIRAWLADCVRAGLVIVPALEGWRAALVAADCVIGDHGAVTCYGAAIGRPVLLAAFPEDDVAAGSPVDVLGRLAPRLDPVRDVSGQVDRVIAEHRAGWFGPVEQLVSSCPDASPRLLRRLCYDELRLDEPATEPMLARVPDTGTSRPDAVSATVVHAHVDRPARTVRLRRHPAEFAAPTDAHHIAVGLHHPGRLLRAQADVVHARLDELATPPADALDLILSTHPGCALAAVTEPGRCTVQTRDGVRLVLSGSDGAEDAWASAAYAWLAAGYTTHDGITLVIGGRETVLSISS